MNLLVLVVWCGLLLSCTFSLPRKRQIRYPVTKPQNYHYERSRPTALEVLERSLLHPSDRKRRHSPTRSGRKPYGEVRGDIDRCVASFGDHSPLCKPRTRQKKSFVGIPDFHRRRFRSDTGVRPNMTVTTPHNLEDFFGIFGSSSAQFTESSQIISKFDFSTVVAKTDAIASNITKIGSEGTPKSTTKEMSSSVTDIQVVTTLQNVTQPTSKGGLGIASIASDDAANKQEASKIILPGSVQKIESGTQYLYIEEDDRPKVDAKDGSYIKDPGEPGGVGGPGVDSPSLEGLTEAATSTLTRVTLPPLTKSVLTGPAYKKTQCESDENKKCICSLSAVESDFLTIFNKVNTEDDAMAEIASLICRRYIPVPRQFDLNTNAKPRVLKAKHTLFAVDNSHGAKEVTAHSLDEFIVNSAIDDGITRVFVSADVKLPCFPKPDIHLSATDADHVKYTWTYGSKKDITKGRITESPDGDGSLLIEDVELTDAMNYTCEIDYIHPDTGERTTDTFTHSLVVVTLPIVSARAKVHYRSNAICDEALLNMFEMYLPQMFEKTICTEGNNRLQLCNVVVHSPVCHVEGEAEKRSKRKKRDPATNCYREKRETSMEMSLNFDAYIHRNGERALPAANPDLCDPDCHLLLNFKLLQIFKESVQEVALIPIESKVQGGGTFTPVPDSVVAKYIFGCIGGYYLDNGFCLACPKGMYSDDGATECQKCPLHTYSTTVGARICTTCQLSWMPICNEYFESINIKIIIFVVALVALLLLLFIVYYVFFYKGQNWRDVIKKGPKEKVAKSERVRTRREAKRLKAEKEAKKKDKRLTQEDIQRLLISSEESDTETESTIKSKSKQ